MRVSTFFLLVALTAISSASKLPVYSTCSRIGKAITSARGRITSPNFPREYPGNLNCSWRIRSAKGSGIKLTIGHLDNKEVFDGGSGKCNDKLRILSANGGNEVDAHEVAELCAKSINDLRKTEYEIKNEGDGIVVAEISFTSDYADQGTGFSIQFETLCNQTQSGESGTITSLNYPGDYHNNAECFTEINAPVGSTIEINFSSFKVERKSVCTADYIAVSEGPPGLYGSRPKKYCGDVGVIFVNANIATVKFVSDRNIVHSGFKATWKAVYPTTPSPTTTIETTTPEMKNCSYTNESILCQRWDATTPHIPKHIPKDNNHNFCRNPDRDNRGAWCYTTDSKKRWGYCDLDNCIVPTTTTAETTTTEPTKVIATNHVPTTTDMMNANISDSFVGVAIGNPTPGKQVSDAASGIPWFIYIILGVALLVVVVVVLVIVRRRRRKKAAMITIQPNASDTVAFNQLERDEYGERPRENTYVEIPFLGEIHDGGAARRAEEEHQTCGKNFVRLDNRGSKNSSVSSHDSILLAKEAAQGRFAAENRGASTSDANPYSVAEDTAPPFPEIKDRSSLRQENPRPNADNVYQSIETSQQQFRGNIFAGAPLPPTPLENGAASTQKGSGKKKSKEWNILKKSSKNDPPPTGFSNPSYREKEHPQEVDSEEENPFDTDEEVTAELNSTYNIPRSNTFENDSNLYNAPSVIPVSPEAQNEADDKDKSHPSTDSPYMIPKLPMPSKVPTDTKMISISPDIIDDRDLKPGFNDAALYSSPGATSPVFDLPENFTYDAPRDVRPTATSISSKSDSDSGQTELSRDSSTKSDRDSGNASMSAIESIGDDKNHAEYCTMNSVPRPAKIKTKLTPEEAEENRLSQLYLSMKGLQSGDRRISESSWSSTKKKPPTPRKSL